MLSAICSRFDQSNILLSGNGVGRFVIQIHQWKVQDIQRHLSCHQSVLKAWREQGKVILIERPNSIGYLDLHPQQQSQQENVVQPLF